jgi:hypothetical protein
MPLTGAYGPRSRERKLRNHAVQYSNLIVTTPTCPAELPPARTPHKACAAPPPQRLLLTGSTVTTPPNADTVVAPWTLDRAWASRRRRRWSCRNGIFLCSMCKPSINVSTCGGRPQINHSDPNPALWVAVPAALGPAGQQLESG